MDLELAGKVVLVTGGSDGLGAALVRTLCAERARVAFCGRSEDRVRTVADEVSAAGGDVLGVRADVTDVSDLEGFVSAAHDRWGRIDGLVNNAGTSSAIPFDQQTESAWDDDLDLKLRAAIRTIRLVLPYLRIRGRRQHHQRAEHRGAGARRGLDPDLGEPGGRIGADQSPVEGARA